MCIFGIRVAVLPFSRILLDFQPDIQHAPVIRPKCPHKLNSLPWYYIVLHQVQPIWLGNPHFILNIRIFSASKIPHSLLSGEF